MGRGDKRTRRGKIFAGSFGNTRKPRKRNTVAKVTAIKAAAKKAAAKK